MVPFASEGIRAVKKTWHKLCFKCNSCGSQLALGKESVHQGSVSACCLLLVCVAVTADMI